MAAPRWSLPVDSDLGKRVATAGIAAPLAALCIAAGGPWAVGIVLVVATLCVWELSRLQRFADPFPLFLLALPSTLAFPLGTATSPELAWLVLGATAVGGLAWVAAGRGRAPDRSGNRTERRLGGWALVMGGGLYVGALLAVGLMLRQHPDGLVWATTVVGATWACDTVAFLVGRRWGRHRFAATVSPGKTVEGSIAGAAAAVMVAAIGGWLWAQPVPRALMLGVVVGIGAVVGDLLESALKRRLGAKDSGAILPGHGGMLDRIDSLLVTLFLGYLYVIGTEGLNQP